MPVSHNQKAFHGGEWAPDLNARVDLQKYHSAAALLRNFFVDYRGGASTRPGTKYILQALKSLTPVRIIRFQASFTINYVLEFGDGYIRFYFNGAPIIETGKAPTAITAANPPAVTSVAHGFNTADWVFAQNIVGMTQLNGRYFQVTRTDADHFTLQDLQGNNIDASAYTAFISGGTFSRVYTLASPYAAADLAQLKFAQNVNTMVLTHPSYAPYQLTLVTATSWTLVAIQFGASIVAPTGVSATTSLAAGTISYSYVVTAVDFNGQESGQSSPGGIASQADIVTTASKTNHVTWNPVTGAFAYNVYAARRLDITGGVSIPSGAAYGFIGSARTTQLDETSPGLPADYTLTPPIPKNPFVGGSISSYTVTAAGAYTSVPTVTVAAPPSGSGQATAQAVLQVQGTPASGASSIGWHVGDAALGPNGVRLIVATVNGSNLITSFQPVTYPGANPGSILSGNTPANPVTFNAVLGSGLNPSVSVTLTWGVGAVIPIQSGAAYNAASPPAVTFSAGAAAATATVGNLSGGNPAVPAYFQQRLVLAGATGTPQTFNMSRPGAYFNFDQSDPTLPNDAISGTLVSNQLNTIKHMISMPTGLIMLTSAQAWLVNGGGAGTAITPSDATAAGQAYSGSSDVPPILANADLIYVQSKGSSVRHMVFDFYKGVYTGTDISILSSHLFFGFTIIDWAFAEEPFKLVWAIRSDGIALSLTFLKEQELIGWAHSDTNGLFKSVCAVTEAVTPGGNVDATYFVVQRVINGVTVQYIERLADRFWTIPSDCWCVDAGLRYSGVPATSFSGGEHLKGQTIVGLADGVPITPFVMPASGTFTLPAASIVTVGLQFLPQLQTLVLDLGEPSVIGKLKKLIALTIRAKNALGIWFGRTLATVMPSKDFSGSANALGLPLPYVLTTDDSRQPFDPLWDQDGQYFITQPNPLPATILGVIPEVKVEDMK